MCEKMEIYISRLIDDNLNNEEKEEVLAHLNDCEECTEYYNNLISIKNLIDDFDEIELPENFHEDSMNYIKANLNKKEPIKINFKRSFTYVASIIAMLFIVTPLMLEIDDNLQNLNSYDTNTSKEATSTDINTFTASDEIGQSPTLKSAKNEMANDVQAVSPDTAMLRSYGANYDPTAQYKIYTTNINLEVDDLSNLYQKISDNYAVKNSNISLDNYSPNIYAYINVDSDNYDKTINDITAQGNVTDINSTITDVSDQVLSLEVAIDENNKQKNKYLGLLKETDNAKDMFALEDEIFIIDQQNTEYARELADLKYRSNNPSIEINGYTNIVMTEKTFKNKTFLENIKDTFISSINFFVNFAINMFNLLVFVSVPLITFIAFLSISLFIILKRRRKK